jgi:hypothetical protein
MVHLASLQAAAHPPTSVQSTLQVAPGLHSVLQLPAGFAQFTLHVVLAAQLTVQPLIRQLKSQDCAVVWQERLQAFVASALMPGVQVQLAAVQEQTALSVEGDVHVTGAPPLPPPDVVPPKAVAPPTEVVPPRTTLPPRAVLPARADVPPAALVPPGAVLPA